MRVWLVRAGREGRYEDLARDNGVALIGWSDLGELSEDLSRDELKEMIRETLDEQRAASLGSQAGQIYRFINEIEAGDLVVLPLMSEDGHVAVGRVTGGYMHRTDGPFAGTDAQNTRPVDWLARSLPYERFEADLREAFGQQGTVSEISKPNAARRIIDTVEGADAAAIHLVLKWSPTLKADTVDLHRAVAEEKGAVWWGRLAKPGATGLSADWLKKLRQQLDRGSTTHVFLHSSASTWRTRLLDVSTETVLPEDEQELIPNYYDPTTHHSLWVKITDFEETDPGELTDGYVLAQSGEPVTSGGLGNQTPLIVRQQSVIQGGRYFVLDHGEGDTGGYEDAEGERYHWTEKSLGAWKQLANSQGARFVYSRPGQAQDEAAGTYFAFGRLASISHDEIDGVRHFVAELEDVEPFESPVPWTEGPPRNAHTSIQPITRAQYERLVSLGFPGSDGVDFDLEAVRAAAEAKGLSLAPEIYGQLLAALLSGKHVILTGPPGTAKTTLAQATAEAAHDAGRSAGYTLTTATADWTTFETIGGLRPNENQQLEFAEGLFLKAIRNREWLIIDELNRSNFDRAFGQLFTVLSGQPVVLPYSRPGQEERPLTLVPEGVESPLADADVLGIPQDWRIVATMNVFDKTLLFEMSFALMRRFAFIEVASPAPAVFEALIDQEAATETVPAELTKRLLELRKFKDLGPAVFMDLARFMRARVAMGETDEGQLLFEGFYSYLLPQFEGIDAVQGDALFKALAKMIGPGLRQRLRETLNSVLGLEIQPRQAVSEDGDEDDEDDLIDDEPPPGAAEA